MNGVDVLAVLDDVIADMGDLPGTQGHELAKARAAVAELVKAAAEMNRLAKGPAGGVSATEKRSIVGRMDSALANVRGAA